MMVIDDDDWWWWLVMMMMLMAMIIEISVLCPFQHYLSHIVMMEWWLWKGSVQWDAEQSWVEFRLQRDSNPRRYELKSRALTARPPELFYSPSYLHDWHPSFYSSQSRYRMMVEIIAAVDFSSRTCFHSIRAENNQCREFTSPPLKISSENDQVNKVPSTAEPQWLKLPLDQGIVYSRYG